MNIKKLISVIVTASLISSLLPFTVKAVDDKEIIVKLTDSILYDYRNFTSEQEGTLYFTKYDNTTSISGNNDQITVTHTKMADWASNFYVDGSPVSTGKKTVVDIRFKTTLERYDTTTKPKLSLRLYHNGGSFNISTDTFIPKENSGYSTARFVVNPTMGKTYVSLNGSPYKSARLSNPSNSTYGGQIRIYPVAIPSISNKTDRQTDLETPATFIFDEVHVYQVSGDMPTETEDLVGEISQEESQEFDSLRERWKTYLTGGDTASSDPKVQAKITSINNSAKYHWNRMNKESGRTYLFDDVTNLSASSHIRTDYSYLLTLARAYATPGGELYKNEEMVQDLISALDWMYENEYNETMSEYDNWWEWEIGVPEALNNIIVLIYDKLSEDRITKYEKAVNHFSPDPRYCNPPHGFVSTAANRLSMCFVVGLRGIIVKDPARVRLASDSLDIVFDYVTSGDGFYRDGSFIQHGNVPYNGGYGLGMVSDLSTMMFLLSGSSYEVTAENKNNVYDWIYKSYVPLMHHGIMMDSVTGRSGSRSHNSTYCMATMLKTAILLTDEADGENKEKLKSIAKTLISEDTLNHLYVDTNIEVSVMNKMNALMNDPSVSNAEIIEGNFQFAGMDRVVHRRKNYSFAVSMHSDRIYNFESILGENLRGWYTSDGMTYLYDNDYSQYTDAFWPTVNAYRLPGTTVTQKNLSSGEGASSLSSESYAGGASVDGMYGSAGMSLKSQYSDLKAKKSWFMFDDEIVALGAGITGTGNTETTIDNRKLNYNNTLTVDGTAKATGTGAEEVIQNAKWMHLSGNAYGADVGYYLFGGENVKALRETRFGSWYDINTSDSRNINIKNYMNLVIDHGSDPVGKTYAYAILPGKSADEVRAYSQNPNVRIIKNTSSVQAVENTALGIVGANFFEDTPTTAGKITSDKQSAVMVHDDGETLSFGISDPTQKNTGTVEITYDESAGEIISCDDTVTVLATYPNIKLSVNVDGTMGATQSIKLKKAGQDLITPYILEDKNISVDGPTNGEYVITSEGSVKMRCWTSPAANVTADSETFSITQQKKSVYKDHLLLTSHQPIPHDTPTLVNIRYKVNAQTENSGETAAMKLYIPGVSSWKAMTGTINLDEDMNEYRTFMFLISPEEEKVYYTADGVNFNETNFEGDLTQAITEARLYLIAQPDSEYSATDDGSLSLDSPVTWTFDRLEISPYVDDGRHIRISSFGNALNNDGIGYTIEAVNVSAFPQSASVIAAAYTEDGKLSGVSINHVSDMLYNEKVVKTDIIKTDTTENLTVRAFIWDGINSMKPYDKSE